MKRFALLSAAALLALAGCASEPPQPPAQVQAYYEQNKALPMTEEFVQVAYDKVKPVLLDPAQPFSISVIGDSTGNEPGEWVDVAMRAIAERTRRPLIMHVWNLDTNAYNPPQTLIESAGQPLVVFNGSASGKSGPYSLEHYATMVPEVTNLAIISHGHNITVPAQAQSQIQSVVSRIRMTSDGKTAIGVTLQNPESGANRDRNEQVVSSIRELVTDDKGLFLIDAHAALTARGSLALDLRPDGLHPSESGSAVWAETTMGALGF